MAFNKSKALALFLDQFKCFSYIDSLPIGSVPHPFHLSMVSVSGERVGKILIGYSLEC